MAHKLLHYDRLSGKKHRHKNKIEKKAGPTVKHANSLTRRNLP